MRMRAMSKYTGAYPSVYKVIDYQKKLADEANRLAYSGRPKEAHYPEGHPTAQCQKAFNAQKGTYKFWSDASRKSASCDVSAAISVHSVYDKNFPWGLWKQQKYMNAHPEAYKKVAIANAKAGDIGHYTKTGLTRKGHIFILGEGNQVKEGSAGNWFLSTTTARSTRLSMENKKSLTIYRVVNQKKYSPLKKGSKGDEVKKLQKYINWYFKGSKDWKALKVDGDFGPITDKAAKAMQKGLKVTIDGIVGTKTLAAMQKKNK